MTLAGKQSGELDHGWVGDEHVLLALLHPDCPGVAREALGEFAVTLEGARRAVIDSVGDSFPTADWKPLLRSTQHVLERANLKAIELRDEEVSGEHALLALLEAPDDSRGLGLLAEEGADHAALARHVIALTDRGPTGSGATGDAPPPSGEVHAAEVARILAVGRRRVAELAAAAPDFPSSEVGARGYRVWSRAAVESWAVAHPDRGPRLSKLKPPVPGTVSPGTNRILEIAKAEARELNHDCVLPNHLFLALLHPDCRGEAREALVSLGLALKDARESYVESMGDPHDPHDHELRIPPATFIVLERATLEALELEDEQVTGAHVLLALTEEWEEGSLLLREARLEVSATALRERLMAVTDGMLPAIEPPPPRPDRWVSSKRIPRPPEPELAPSPLGHDPRRRKHWGSAGFTVAGRTTVPLHQYCIDRDGYPVLTTDGQPVGSLTDEEGKIVLDQDGKGILTAVEIPEGAEVRSYPR